MSADRVEVNPPSGVFTEACWPECRGGKYLRWTTYLSADAIVAVLVLAGQFGERYDATRTAQGELPTPAYEDPHVVRYRLNAGLRSMADAHRTSAARSDPDAVAAVRLRSGLAWTPDFAARLLATPGAAWAAMLDAVTLYDLMWGIGEYEIRMHDAVEEGRLKPQMPPRFPTPPPTGTHMRAYLLQLVQVSELNLADLEAVRRDWPQAIAMVS